MTALKPKELLQLRLKHGIKRAQMARFFGLEGQTLWRWEMGQDHAPLYATHLYHYYLNRFGYLEDSAEGRRQDVETAH